MSAEFEATILAEIRRTHAQLKKTPPSSTPAQGNGVHGWSMRLTVEEVDVLLAIVDERDALKRRLLSDWEPEIHPVVSEPIDGASERARHSSCPFVDMIHACPLGGCPDASPREVQIPDLPKQGRAEKATRELIDDVGREARETPPESTVEMTFGYPRCAVCGVNIAQGRDEGTWIHLGTYLLSHELHKAVPIVAPKPIA
jgi:hypothetical protein